MYAKNFLRIAGEKLPISICKRYSVNIKISESITKDNVYLHPDLEFWTELIANGDHMETF